MTTNILSNIRHPCRQGLCDKSSCQLHIYTSRRYNGQMPRYLYVCVPFSVAVSEMPQRAVFLPTVIVKEGYLQKHKAEGAQLLSRFASKKRYFWLTSETLSHAKTPDWQVGSKSFACSIYKYSTVFAWSVGCFLPQPHNMCNSLIDDSELATGLNQSVSGCFSTRARPTFTGASCPLVRGRK